MAKTYFNNLGSERGNRGQSIIRQKLISGELVKVPIGSIPYTQNGVTASTSSYINQDGSAYDVSMDSTTVIGQSGGTTWLTCILYGSTIGIRFSRQATTPPFCVVIDGTPYEVPEYKRVPYNINTVDSALFDWETLLMIAENLDDTTPHTVSIYIPVDPSGTKNLRFFGFLLEKKAGYRETLPGSAFYGNGQLGTADQFYSVPRTFGSNLPNVKALMEICYTNVHASATAKVTLQSNTNYLLVNKDLAPGETFTRTFPGNGVNMASTLQHKSSVSNAINFTCIGRI